MSVRMGLLSLLAEGSAHGYGLKAAFEARTGGVWTLNVGQVYTTLDRLQAEGLVAPMESSESGPEPSPTGRDRHLWQITPAGKAELEDWFDEAGFDTAPPRDELLVKVLMAFGRSSGEALAVIDRQRAELYRVAQAHRRSRSRAARAAQPGDGAADPTHSLALMAADLMGEAIAARHEADLRWLDHCEEAIVSNPERRKP
ncbi:MAG: PadR family transcriptional regulator [Acidimicrobiales bacterium]|nr:PadR family transcriptional regulator [Acidimicrobiales bacterium]